MDQAGTGTCRAALVRMHGTLNPLAPLTDRLLAGLDAGPEAVLDACGPLAGLAGRLGDRSALRLALFLSARAHAELGDAPAGLRHARRLLEDLPAEARSTTGLGAARDDVVWNALARALEAGVLLSEGDVAGGVPPLAEALAVLDDLPATTSVDVLARDVAAEALVALLLFEEAAATVGEALRAVRVLPAAHPHRAVLTATLQRRRAHVHALWAARLDLLGRDREADGHRVVALSAAQHLRRTAAGAWAAHSAQALEAFALSGLGGPHRELGGRLAPVHHAAPPPDRALLDTELARLALARTLAAEGDLVAARTLARRAVRGCEGPGRRGWLPVCRVEAADLECADDAVEHPAVTAWRSVAASGLARVWSDRQSRRAELQRRMQRRELTRHEARASAQLLVDPLTGLGNRRLLDSALDDDRTGGAVFIDLDDFKLINDHWGHATGDAVLRRLADLLRGCTRGGDLVLRYGGDEFLVLTEPASPAAALGRRVLAAVRGADWSDLVGDLPVRVSVGTADHGLLRDALLRSDAAVMSAKRRGRDVLVQA